MSKAFQDDKGNGSSMRWVWAICVLTIMFTWSYVCIKAGTLFSFQIGDATLMAFLFGGKVGQKYLEAKNGKQ
jgi:hypothetical protein